MSKKKQKIRVQFRKNRQKNTQRLDLTRKVREEGVDSSELPSDERISGKGDLTRYRTVVGVTAEDGGELIIDIDELVCVPGRVLNAHGAASFVQLDDGRVLECTVRRVVRTLARDARTAVVAGDRVFVNPQDELTGVIERVDPRHGTISRGSKRRQHVLVANVDQVVIVASADNPPLKPGLIDRYLISADLGEVEAILCINKTDLVEPAALQPIAGLYAQLGFQVVLTSTSRGDGIAALRSLLRDRETVFTGQSGVGKSSLLNAVQPGLELRTGDVSEDSGKGRHTTTTAKLLQLDFGGWVVDTPGIRQLELWDVEPVEISGYFVEFEPFLPQCRFPDCSHTHETECGVKRAVARGMISPLRYESYTRILAGDAA